MQTHEEEIQDHPLFDGIRKEELSAMLKCLGCYTRAYKKDEIILLPMDKVKCVGMILKGSIHMIKEDADGNTVLLVHLRKGELFGESFVCGSCMDSRVAFMAAADCEVFYLPFHKVISTCSRSCAFHHRLIENMVRLISDKNVRLMEKVEIISRKSLREKILAYLTMQAEKQGRHYFRIPLGRSELAEYLCADRSALSRELARMKDEGSFLITKTNFVFVKEITADFWRWMYIM